MNAEESITKGLREIAQELTQADVHIEDETRGTYACIFCDYEISSIARQRLIDPSLLSACHHLECIVRKAHILVERLAL